MRRAVLKWALASDGIRARALTIGTQIYLSYLNYYQFRSIKATSTKAAWATSWPRFEIIMAHDITALLSRA